MYLMPDHRERLVATLEAAMKYEVELRRKPQPTRAEQRKLVQLWIKHHEALIVIAREPG